MRLRIVLNLRGTPLDACCALCGRLDRSRSVRTVAYMEHFGSSLLSRLSTTKLTLFYYRIDAQPNSHVTTPPLNTHRS